MAAPEAERVPGDLRSVSDHRLQVANQTGGLFDAVSRLQRDGRAVEVPHARLGQDQPVAQGIVKVRRARKRNGQADVRRQRDVGTLHDLVELAPDVRDAPGGQVQDEPVEEDHPGLQALLDDLDLRSNGVVAFVVTDRPLAVEGLDTAEESRASRVAREAHIGRVEEEVAGYEGRPAAIPPLPPQRPGGGDALAEAPPVTAVEVVVQEHHVSPASTGADLGPDRLGRIGAVRPAFRRHRAEGAREVAVPAGLGVSDATDPVAQVVAPRPRVRRVARAERLAHHVAQLLDVPLAGVVEEGPAVARKRPHDVATAHDDHLRVERARISRHLPHAIERSDESGEHDEIGPREDALVLQRAVEDLVVQSDVPRPGVERPRQEDGPEGLRHLVRTGDSASGLVDVAVDDEGSFLPAHTTKGRRHEMLQSGGSKRRVFDGTGSSVTCWGPRRTSVAASCRAWSDRRKRSVRSRIEVGCPRPDPPVP